MNKYSKYIANIFLIGVLFFSVIVYKAQAAGVVSGSVFFDVNGNGTDDGVADSPVQYMWVRLWNDVGNNNTIDVGVDTIAAGAMTNNLGDYTFTSLADGDYLLEAYDPTNQLGPGTFTDTSSDGVLDITIAGGGVTGQSVGFHKSVSTNSGTISSTVKIDENTANGPGAVNLIADDRYGTVAGIGDLNGDGVQDIAVGAGFDEGTDANSGALYIHFMNTDGTIDSTVKIDENTANGPGAASLEASDNYGTAVTTIGDLNGDGVQDLAVGAITDEGTDLGSGAFYIHFMNTDGTIDSTVKIDENTVNGVTAASLDAGDAYGAAIANIGDLNGDGVQDLAVGAYFDEGTDSASGAIYIHFMNTDGTIDSTVKIDENTANGPGAASLDGFDFYGVSIANLNDLNGDGVQDLAVGAFLDEGTDASSGALYIHFMNTDGTIDSTVKIDENTANGPGAASLAASDLYGGSVANLGDLNGDGVQDIIVGAPADEGTDLGSGAFYLHYMNTDGTIDSTVKFDENTANGATAASLNASDQYGSYIANIGDLNGDGIQDIAVGAYADEGTDASSGAIYIHFLVAPAVITNVTSSTPDGTYASGNLITINVTFNQTVTVTGVPLLTLETGTTDGVASYVSGDGTDTLNFDFTPTSAHEVSDLEYVNIISLTLNGGTVLDAGLNNANLTLPTLGGAGSLGFNKEIAIFTPEPSPSSSSGSRPRTRSVINTYIPPVDILPIDISPIESTDKNCTAFTKDIRLGLATNDSNEIKLWQAFLNKNFDSKLLEDGIYGKMTLQAVKNFQTKYAEEILAPWGLVRATGFIHKTTRSKANNIMGCSAD